MFGTYTVEFTRFEINNGIEFNCVTTIIDPLTGRVELKTKTLKNGKSNSKIV